MDITDDTEIGLFVRFIPVLMLVAFVGGYLLINKPTQSPPSSTLSGCFAANGSLIAFDGKDLLIDHGRLRSTYRFSLEKYGTLIIDTEPPVHLRKRKDGSLEFLPGDSEWIYAMRPVHVVNGKAYGVITASDADYIEITSDDRSLFAFRPVEMSRCK